MASSAETKQRLPSAVRGCIPDGERIVTALKPHPAVIVFESIGGVIVCVIVIAATFALDAFVGLGRWPGNVYAAFGTLGAAFVLWSVLAWFSRWYVRTDRRVLSFDGVVSRFVSEAPVDSVRASALVQRWHERVLGLGSVGFATAGTGGYEVVWRTIARPGERLREVLGDIGIAASEDPQSPSRPVIIGIAGGIGSGKSAVARAFEQLGCVVSDSDRDTDDALAREDVRATLRSWWGDGVIREDGSVDRKAVAKIVFADADERSRLEGVIHPLVHEARAARIAEAANRGIPAVVIDAPLLFEAGVDRECDAVVYVEASQEVREARVRASRGWDEGELASREKAQLPLEHKRERSDYVIVNEGHEQGLIHQADRVLQLIRTEQRSAAP